jgi:putative membrane protein
MMHGYDMGGGGWIVPALVWLVLLVAIVVVVSRIFPARDDRAAPPAEPLEPPVVERPLEILDRRLARGEIDVETYDRVRERLLEAARGR